MDKNNFKKILFKVAFCAMACDGQIQKEEIQELRIMDKRTSYFSEIDLSDELKQLIENFKEKGTKVIQELFVDLRQAKLNPIQELLVLEVALRIVNADNINEENEKRFVHLLRSKLKLHDETIKDRFGALDILHTSEYSRNIEMGKTEIEFTNSVKLPEISELTKIDLNRTKSND